MSHVFVQTAWSRSYSAIPGVNQHCYGAWRIFIRDLAAAVPFLRREAGRPWAELRAATDLV